MRIWGRGRARPPAPCCVTLREEAEEAAAEAEVAEAEASAEEVAAV